METRSSGFRENPSVTNGIPRKIRPMNEKNPVEALVEGLSYEQRRHRGLKPTEFKLADTFKPTGDQPDAIEQLVQGVKENRKHQVLLGVTGSGKTFTMANVIERVQRPALVLAHNKTLAAQLYSEFKELFPDNAVEYFVSYYDYYQPEAYIPSTDTYVDKESTINDEIDRMRLSATRSLFERDDVIIVASVSCIYGLGSAEAYFGMMVFLYEGLEIDRGRFLKKLVSMQYERNDVDFHRGTFRVRGDNVEIFPAYEEDRALRVEFWGDEVSEIKWIDPLTGKVTGKLTKVAVYPASHYVVTADRLQRAMDSIRIEMAERVGHFDDNMKLLESQRLNERTRYDLEMLEQMGYCSGIENYSRHFTGRLPGEAPPCLLDFFPQNWLMFIDESHVTVSQVGGMYRGDRSRKENLVEFGFRLPSALDNRPLKFDEFEKRLDQVIYVSATPADYELEKAEGVVVEQVIRPTGLVDPVVEIRPAAEQIYDLLEEIQLRIESKERVLVTTLTKRMAEELTDYYNDLGIKVTYLHSDIDTLERMAIIRDLRLGKFDVLVGINLLREGLDIPEVSLVAILDADKEGFLRSERSLIQTMGRAARHVHGKAILYADFETKSMKKAIGETERRRKIQIAYNEKHSIEPRSIKKAIHDMGYYSDGDYLQPTALDDDAAPIDMGREELRDEIDRLNGEMIAAAEALEFEKAADLRDQIKILKKIELQHEQKEKKTNRKEREKAAQRARIQKKKKAKRNMKKR